jgi:hypothetical protein
MKKIVAIIVFMHVVGLVGLLHAQEPREPKIIAREVQYDFGKIVQGTMASHVFEIRNGGSGPLDIERVAPS